MTEIRKIGCLVFNLHNVDTEMKTSFKGNLSKIEEFLEKNNFKIKIFSVKYPEDLDNILKCISDINPTTLFFYYVGHGQTPSLPPGTMGYFQSSPQSRPMFQDAPGTESRIPLSGESEVFSKFLTSISTMVTIPELIMIIDCCYAPGVPSNSKPYNKTQIYISSSQSDTVSFYDAQSSLFTKIIFDFLNNKGNPNLVELLDEIENKYPKQINFKGKIENLKYNFFPRLSDRKFLKE